MDNFIFCLNAVLPSFFIIATGFLVRVFHLMDESAIKQLNRTCFFVFLPIVMFRTAYTSDFSRDFDIRVVLATLIALLSIIAIMTVVAPRFTKERGKIGVMIQGSFRSNAVLMGIPLAISLCGEEAAGPAAVLVVFVVPLYNLLSVVVFSFFNNKEKTRPNLKTVCKKILTNPLIVGFLIGFALNMVNMPLPKVITSPVGSLATAGSTVCMFGVGTQLNFKNAVNNLRLTLTSAFAKLLVVPAIGTVIAFTMGLRGPFLCAPFIILAMPCATASVAQADGMNADGALAAEMVIFTTAASAFTVFIGSFILKTLNLI